MRIHLVNPSQISSGIAVITPRWLYVLAAATPQEFGDPCLVDETLVALDPEQIRTGDVVGIGIHTANALRGYAIGKMARERGAYVVFGGIHATLYPAEAHELGGAHAVVKGVEMLSGQRSCRIALLELLCRFVTEVESTPPPSCPPDGNLVPRNSYMWASVQTKSSELAAPTVDASI